VVLLLARQTAPDPTQIGEAVGRRCPDQDGTKASVAVDLQTPSTDHHRPRRPVSELQPVGASPPGAVPRRKPFAHHTFQSLLQGRGLERVPVVIRRRHLDTAAGQADPLQRGPPFHQRPGCEIHAIQAQYVEHHVGDGVCRSQLARLGDVADMHAIGQRGERGEPLMQRNDLAIEQHVAR